MRTWLEAAGLEVTLKGEDEQSETPVTQAMLERWFTPAAAGRPAYVDRLSALLDSAAIAAIRALFERQLVGQTVAWQAHTVFVVARRPG